MNDTLKSWFVLYLIPLAPVIALYWFFNNQNYFNLTDTSKGLVATGPIAAYIFLVGLGWNIYSNINKTLSPVNKTIKTLVGDWDLESVSGHNTVRKGTCKIRDDKGSLKITGNFISDGKSIGDWESEMVKVDPTKLAFSYELSELDGSTLVRSDGICSLQFGASPVSEMKGTWILIGKGNAAGTITYTRIS
jgi:hypothetical protein